MTRSSLLAKFSRFGFSLVVVCSCATGVLQRAAAEEGLFSDIRVDSVFEDDTKEPTGEEKSSTDAKSARVRNVDHLGRLLRIEGFGFEQVGSRTFGATTEIDDWTFPTLVTLSRDGNRVGLILGLVRFEDSGELSSDKMLELLVANQAVAPYQFSFNKDRERTELVIVLENEDIDSGRLASEIERLKKIGRDTESIWYDAKDGTETTTDSNVADSSPTQSAPSQQSPKANVVTSQSLVGQWSFAKSKTEAFALRLTADGKFKLVQVANGQTNTSEGTYQVNEGKLVMAVANGVSLSGPVEMTNARGFQFTPVAGNAPLVFSKISG